MKEKWNCGEGWLYVKLYIGRRRIWTEKRMRLPSDIKDSHLAEKNHSQGADKHGKISDQAWKIKKVIKADE